MSAAAATSRADRLFLVDAKANVNCIGTRLRDIVEDEYLDTNVSIATTISKIEHSHLYSKEK